GAADLMMPTSPALAPGRSWSESGERDQPQQQVLHLTIELSDPGQNRLTPDGVRLSERRLEGEAGFAHRTQHVSRSAEEDLILLDGLAVRRTHADRQGRGVSHPVRLVGICPYSRHEVHRE